MIHLKSFYDKSIYNTEGKYVGKVKEVVLNIKKGRISFFKTKPMAEDTKSVGGLRDILRNSMRLVPDEEEEEQPIMAAEDIIDIPYEIVTAVGDIIIIDQNKLAQYHAALSKKAKAPLQQQPKSSIKKQSLQKVE